MPSKVKTATFKLPDVPDAPNHVWADYDVSEVEKRMMAAAYRVKGSDEPNSLGALLGKIMEILESTTMSAREKSAVVIQTVKKMLGTLDSYVDMETPYVFWNGCYQNDSTHKRLDEAIGICCNILDHNLSESSVQGIVKWYCRQQHYGVRAVPERRDIIPFQNAFFSVSEGTMYSVQPGKKFYEIRRRYAVTYDPKAKCPQFEGMLKSALPDEESRSRFLDMMALCLMPNKYGVWRTCFCVGTGSNGKGTLLKFLQAVIGLGNYSAASISDMANDFITGYMESQDANIVSEKPRGCVYQSRQDAVDSIRRYGDV